MDFSLRMIEKKEKCISIFEKDVLRGKIKNQVFRNKKYFAIIFCYIILGGKYRVFSLYVSGMAKYFYLTLHLLSSFDKMTYIIKGGNQTSGL